MTDLNHFVPTKPYLICVDSDGCAMDTMDIKHIRCFGPCMVQQWQLQTWQEEILARWNDINLYTMTRGINRFKGLAMALEEIHRKYTPIDHVEDLVAWAAAAPELSNRAVEQLIAQNASPIFPKVLAWSLAVNQAINQLPQEQKRPFPGAKEGLAAAHALADVAVVSSANRDAVEEEWNLYGLLEDVDVLLCQDAGSKAHCIARLMEKGYAPDHVLMVGDAPGDREAAKQNNAWFYPILVRREQESWQQAPEAFRLLAAGLYSPYGREREQAFLENLKG